MADRMPLIYIAGPFRAANGLDLHRNICEAEALGYRVAELGAVPVIPHTMYRHFDRTLDDQFWLNGTLELLRPCHAAVFSARWTSSAGSRGEHRFCEQEGIEFFGVAHLERPAPSAPCAVEQWILDWKARIHA